VVRKRKPSGVVNRGPFSASDIKAALLRAGAVERVGGNHQKVYVHPELGWKVPVSEAWTSVRKGDPIFNGMVRTTGLSAAQLLEHLNGM
jgi:hypothetical protein